MRREKSFIEHGGDIYTEGRFKGIELIDFSSNINFWGVPKSFTNSISIALENISNYPDLKYRKARSYIKKYVNQGIQEDNIILGNGAAELIKLSIATLKKPCIIVPSFSEYEAAAKQYSDKITFSYLKSNFDFDYNDMLDKLAKCDGLIIANPNNPNGEVIYKESFQEIINYCEKHKKKIIIDEAFIEFADEDKSLINQCKDFQCLFIIRALTKFFGMPGIRLGYGISSDANFIQKLAKMQIPWNINSFAEVAIQTVFNDKGYIHGSRVEIKKEREYLVKKLNQFSFVKKVCESYANFLLVELKGVSDEVLFNYCLAQKILIRRCRNFKGLNDRFIRLAVKSREDNEQLLKVFLNYEKEGIKDEY